MKKTLLLFITSFLFLISFSQTYTPMPTDSASWSQTYWCDDPFGGSDCKWSKHYGVSGDTLINGKTMTRLYGINPSLSIGISVPPPSYIAVDSFIIDSASYVGAYYEDSLKKFLFVLAGDSIEHLLFDFSASMGDTLCLSLVPYGGSPGSTECVEVISKSTILYEGISRLTYRLEGISSFVIPGGVWVEGIGNDIGWFEMSHSDICQMQTSCMKHKGTFLKHSGDCACHPITTQNDDQQENPKVSLFPNPANDFVTISLGSHYCTSIQLTLCDEFGRIIYAESMTQEKHISLAGLAEGLYFLKVNGDFGTIVKKLVKY